jgi:hypothetical protein
VGVGFQFFVCEVGELVDPLRVRDLPSFVLLVVFLYLLQVGGEQLLPHLFLSIVGVFLIELDLHPTPDKSAQLKWSYVP